MRLIDADALLDRIPNPYERREVSRWVDEATTVDAVPVRHGRWKPFDLTYGRNLYACSVCGDVSDCATVMGDVVYQFCPHCGARMDGDSNDLRNIEPHPNGNQCGDSGTAREQ